MSSSSKHTPGPGIQTLTAKRQIVDTIDAAKDTVGVR